MKNIILIILILFIFFGNIVVVNSQDDVVDESFVEVNSNLVGKSTCSSDGSHYNLVGQIDPYSTTAPNNCLIPNTFYELTGLPVVSGCCSNGFICTDMNTIEATSGFPLFNCLPDVRTKCEDFNTAALCIQANSNGGLPDSVFELMLLQCKPKSVNIGNLICGETYDCHCEWDIPSSTCKSLSTMLGRTCVDKLDGTKTNFPKIDCIVTYNLVDNCNDVNGDGQIHLSWTTEIKPVGETMPSCIPGNKDIACEDIARMDFFGIFNIISVILIICIFYMYRIKKENIKIKQAY